MSEERKQQIWELIASDIFAINADVTDEQIDAYIEQFSYLVAED